MNAPITLDPQAAGPRDVASSARVERPNENAPVLDLATDFEGRILLANRCWNHVLGHASESVVGRMVTAFAHPDFVAELAAALRETAATGARPGLDVPLRCRDGSHRWFAVQLRRNCEHRLLWISAFDISNRKETELLNQRRACVMSLRAETWAALASSSSTAELFNAWSALLLRTLGASAVGIWKNEESDGALRLRALVPERLSPELRTAFDLLATTADETRRFRASKTLLDVSQSPVSLLPNVQKQLQGLCFQPVMFHERVLAVIGCVFARRPVDADAFLLEKVANDMGNALALLAGQDRLRDGKRTCDAILRSASACLCSLDAQGIVRSWSLGAERLLGWTAAEVCGHPLPVVRPEESQLYAACLNGALAGQSTTRVETRAVTKRGDIADVALSIVPVAAADGLDDAAVLAFTDLTDRKRADQRLAAQQAVLRLLADAGNLDDVANGILPLIGELQGWPNAEFWKASPTGRSFERIASWHGSAANAVQFAAESQNWGRESGAAWADGVAAHGKPLRLARIDSDQSVDRAPLAAQCGLRDGFGIPIVVENETAAVLLFFAEEIGDFDEASIGWFRGLAGQIGQYVHRLRLSESLQRTQEDLRQAEKMESVGRLVGGVAHDFNNLLTVILGYGEMVLQEMTDQPALRELLTEVVDAGKRASGLTRQLLAFCRKEAYTPVIFDLNSHVEGMQKMLRRLVGESIELEAVLAPELEHVHADPAQIEQVMMNLVVNARDAMPSGGRITIETKMTDVSRGNSSFPNASPGRYVCIAVKDTGCGMDEPIRSRIFEPFFTTKGAGKGTGMGLATVQSIVQQCGGSIVVDSAPGQGTQFHILLPPAASGLSAWEVDSAPVAIPRGTETILVVEDEGPVRRLLSRLLRVQNYQVYEASNAAEALEICKQHAGEIHLLLTDVVMPDQYGPELAEQVQRIDTRIKTLFVSGYRDSEIKRLGLPDLGDRLLQKPFTTVDLARKIRGVLDGAETVG